MSIRSDLPWRNYLEQEHYDEFVERLAASGMPKSTIDATLRAAYGPDDLARHESARQAAIARRAAELAAAQEADRLAAECRKASARSAALAVAKSPLSLIRAFRRVFNKLEAATRP